METEELTKLVDGIYKVCKIFVFLYFIFMHVYANVNLLYLRFPQNFFVGKYFFYLRMYEHDNNV